MNKTKKALLKAGHLQPSGMVPGQPPHITPTYSPVAMTYQQPNAWGSNYGPGLPYSQAAYSDGSFAPMNPIPPAYIDLPSRSGRPSPRRWQYPVGWNLPIGQPGTENIKLANFQLLRNIAETASIPRACIEICKADVLTLDWSIKPTPTALQDMKGNPGKTADFESRKQELMDSIFSLPDDAYNSFDEFLAALLEDLLVLDAVAVHLKPSYKKGKGILNSDYTGLELIDGSLIRPLVDMYGAPPKPPVPAYQLYLWGLPRTDLLSLIDLGSNADYEDLEALDPTMAELLKDVEQFSGDQLIYLRQTPRSWTVYGFGPLERGILPASMSLARQQWQYDYFDSNSLPRAWMDPGPGVTSGAEAREWGQVVNAMAGDLEKAWQILPIPSGGKVYPVKEPVLSDVMDEWITATCAMTFGLNLVDLGITPKPNGLTSPAMAKADSTTSDDRVSKRSTLPRLKMTKKRLFDQLIQQVFKQTDMEFDWGLAETGKNLDDLYQVATNGWKGSLTTLNEARKMVDLDPLNEKWANEVYFFSANGAQPLSTATESDNAGLSSVNSDTSPQKPTTESDILSQDPKEPVVSKMIGNELDILTRWNAKGKDLKTFKGTFLSGDNIEAIKKQAAQIMKKESTTDKFRDELVIYLLALKKKMLALSITTQEANKQALNKFAEQLDKVEQATLLQIKEEFNFDAETLSPPIKEKITSQAKQSISDLVHKATFDAVIGVGALIIANQLKRFHEHLRNAAANRKNVEATWITEDDPCDLCAERSGRTYTLQDLPGLPGDGDFGELCEGGINCRCSITYKSVTQVSLVQPEGGAEVTKVLISHTDNPKAHSLAQSVYGKLCRDYEPSVVEWVLDLEFETKEIPLKDFRTNRPGGRDNERVEQMVEALKNGWQPEPLIALLDPYGKYIILDGYHRLQALLDAGFENTSGWVADCSRYDRDEWIRLANKIVEIQDDKQN